MYKVHPRCTLPLGLLMSCICEQRIVTLPVCVLTDVQSACPVCVLIDVQGAHPVCVLTDVQGVHPVCVLTDVQSATKAHTSTGAADVLHDPDVPGVGYQRHPVRADPSVLLLWISALPGMMLLMLITSI